VSEKIAVIGLGYVGLPVALGFAKKFPGTVGFDINVEKVKELASGRQLTRPIPSTAGDVVWANDNATLFYTVKDSLDRPHKVLRHAVGSGAPDVVSSGGREGGRAEGGRARGRCGPLGWHPLPAHCRWAAGAGAACCMAAPRTHPHPYPPPPPPRQAVFEEPDDAFYVGLSRSRSEQLLFISCGSAVTSEERFLRADDPMGAPRAGAGAGCRGQGWPGPPGLAGWLAGCLPACLPACPAVPSLLASLLACWLRWLT
jgi:hypothetical protein